MILKSYHFHFVGIGGIGMCGLAELLFNMGAQVSGSDQADNSHTQRLRDLGIKVYKGHDVQHINGADVVVYSSAIAKTNPEILAAQSQSIPIIPRAEALAEIMRLKRGLAVAGTHGKTTTTSLVSSIFLQAKMKPTIVVGGRFEMIKSTALLGEGDWLIAEADESDGSFHKLSPEIAVITNIDSDHLDHFKTFENLEKNFYEFALRVPFYGMCIVCGDDPRVRELFQGYPKKIIFYGFNPGNDFVLRGSNSNYQIFQKDILVSNMKMQVPGEHNALNALAACLAAVSAGISWDIACLGVEKFTGVDRRFQFKGEARQIKVYDDYGHHPTEVRATLQAFREKFPKNRVVVYFQPHRYSRTESCWDEFTKCFTLADKLILTDIYPAGEHPIPQITSERLFQEVKLSDKKFISKINLSAESIRQELKAGDIFVTLGAGDGWKLGMDVLSLLSEKTK